MIVVLDRQGRFRPAHGPADLNPAGPGDVVVVRGEPGARDVAHWSGAIGSAVLRGASVRRV